MALLAGPISFGLLSYQMPVFGREGILASLLLFLSPFAVSWVFTRLLSPWKAPNPS